MTAAHGYDDAVRDAGRRNDVIALLLLFGIITLLFFDVLALGNVFFVRDIALYHYPMKHVVREAMLSGEFPYWNPLPLAGQPLAANPAYELFYPPQWLILLPDYQLGFHLHILLHLYLAAMGMYLLLRRLECSPISAFFGAFSFALGGPLLSVTNLLPFLFTLAWLPWILFFAEGWRRRGRRLQLVLLAAALAMQVLVGEPVVMLQTWALLTAWMLWHRAEATPFLVHARTIVAPAVAAIPVAILLGAVQFLPALDHAQDSVRSIPLEWYAVQQFSFPPVRVLEFFYSYFAGSVGDVGTFYYGTKLYSPPTGPFVLSIYCGMLVAVLVVAGALSPGRDRKFVALWSAASFLAAIGAHTPLLRVLFDSGLLTRVRYMEKFVLSVTFLFVVFASVQLERLLRGDDILRRRAARVAAVVTGLAGLVALTSWTPLWPSLVARVWSIPQAGDVQTVAHLARNQWWWMSLKGVAATLLLAFALRRSRRVALAFALCFLLIDIAPLTNELAPRMTEEIYQPPQTLTALRGESRGGRIFNEAAMKLTVPNSIRVLPTQRIWVTVNGVFPLLSQMWKLPTAMEYDFDETSLMPTRAFFVAMEQLKSASDPAFPAAFMQMSGVTLQLKGVDEQRALDAGRGAIEKIIPFESHRAAPTARYYFAARTVPTPDLNAFVSVLRGHALVGRTAFVPLTGLPVARGRVLRVREEWNRFELSTETTGAGLLVAAVTRHKYWRATVDGSETQIFPVNIAYQGIVVPPGRHVVEFRYRNPLIALGAAISALTALVLLAFAWSDRSVQSRSSS